MTNSSSRKVRALNAHSASNRETKEGKPYIAGIRQKPDEDNGQQKAAERGGEGMAEENEDDVLPDQSPSLPGLEGSSRHGATSGRLGGVGGGDNNRQCVPPKSRPPGGFTEPRTRHLANKKFKKEIYMISRRRRDADGWQPISYNVAHIGAPRNRMFHADGQTHGRETS